MLLLVATRVADPCAQSVAAALANRGATVRWVETADFPARLALSHEPGLLSGDTCPGRTHGRLGDVDLQAVDAVWVRSIEAGAGLPPMADDQRQACISQSQLALWSLVDSLEAVYVLDPAAALLGMPAKPGQQQRAARLGLDVPRSLVSNDADAVRRFALQCPAGLIGKLLASGAVGVLEAGEARAFPTFEITADDLQQLDGLELAPVLFQERLSKRLEVRLTVVGNQRFVAAVAPGAVLDVRSEARLQAAWRRYDDLPPTLIERVLALMDELGLDFGSVDLVLTDDGRWVFLEVNSVSYFDHVETHAGLPVSDAVAALLTGASASRFPARRALQGRR